ncbi:hypothetical protein ALC62_04046 [Cyphomyrmex costatus]|uniref:Uncharacterized protein n=1 Tax=Cyphomyrmex costatus TaxID=456900 RepID=A0A195CWK3_9HYME|nr:hypothetical protein ALC62_04046 [Cyphomyrmex costatus]
MFADLGTSVLFARAIIRKRSGRKGDASAKREETYGPRVTARRRRPRRNGDGARSRRGVWTGSAGRIQLCRGHVGRCWTPSGKGLDRERGKGGTCGAREEEDRVYIVVPRLGSPSEWRKGSTPGTQDHRIVEPLAPGPCLTRVS